MENRKDLDNKFYTDVVGTHSQLMALAYRAHEMEDSITLLMLKATLSQNLDVMKYGVSIGAIPSEELEMCEKMFRARFVGHIMGGAF